jgi:hypothetical protein
MAFILVRHKVTNFETWEAAYDDHRDAREVVGLTELHLLRNRSDPNDIVILFQTDNPERTRAFIWSDDLRKIMHEAGVIGTPEILELE